MDKINLLQILKQEFKNLKVFIDDLKNHTSIKIGGSAIIAEPKFQTQIIKLVDFCNKNKIDFFVLGNGSNVLAGNKIRSLIIKLCSFKKVVVKENIITCSSGASLFKICSVASTKGLSGLEPLYGIPGSIGGAVYMNAGSFGREIKDLVKSVTFTDGKKIYKYSQKKLGFCYRKSMFFNTKYVITKVELILQQSDIKTVMENCKAFFNKKKESQPYNFPSAGSVFKRPPNDFAGRLIENSGLKSKKIGGAEISEKHAGFIVNVKDATFLDVKKLIRLIKATVFKKFGIILTLEIIIIGEKDENLGRLSHPYDI